MKLLSIKNIAFASSLVAGGLIPCVVFGQNIVSNGDFTNSITGWTFSGTTPQVH